MTDSVTVTRNDEAHRYEVHLDGELGGILKFRPAGEGRVVLRHTEIDGAFKGKGLGSALASEALSDLARRGETVIPTCPFVSHYLREHDVPGLVIDWPDEADAADSADPSEPA